jgi:pimeloyl-ACP methyl ester carboxylesterase
MDERERLRDLSKPLLYLRGLSDRLVSEISWITVQKTRPDAQVIPLEGPHMLLQVSPNECWEAVVRFVEETDSIRDAHS